jgi:hypothetical protein
VSNPARIDIDDEELARERARVRVAAPDPVSSDQPRTLGGAIAGELGFVVGVSIVLSAVAVAAIWLLSRG